MPDLNKTSDKNKNKGVVYEYLAPAPKTQETEESQRNEVDPNMSSAPLSDLMSKLKNL